MSGRGRGRGGRGYKPPTGAQLFLQRSAQESGLDERNLRSIQDLTRPDLFPDILWHSSGRNWVAEEESQELVQSKRSQSAIYSIRKAREIQHRMQSSPYYLRPQEEVDIARHRRRTTSNIPCDKKVVKKIANAATLRYIPAELLLKTSPRFPNGSSTGKKNVTFDGLASQHVEGEESDEGEGDEDGVIPDEDEEENEDYTTNYYASDDESNGDDDGEPTI
mmetsp:Transcript_19250/g.28480  ORF Transcript_19250/g.28480 Transcript_19250/m.28480 type:complete len:220 (+) Transcript_19250:100-759(+)